MKIKTCKETSSIWTQELLKTSAMVEGRLLWSLTALSTRALIFAGSLRPLKVGSAKCGKKRHWFSLLYSTLLSAPWLCTQHSPLCPTHTGSLVCLYRPGSYLVPSAPDIKCTQDSSCINSTPIRQQMHCYYFVCHYSDVSAHICSRCIICVHVFGGQRSTLNVNF